MANVLFKTAAVAVGLATLSGAAPNPQIDRRDLHARKTLGTSFGQPGRNKTFDYIIVGGGNAGLTLATRLAEQQSGTVAVIEAGSFYEISNSNVSEIPVFDGTYAGRGVDDWQPLVDWGYVTEPQKGGFDIPIHYARGKTLGGSSARNYMAYQRATKASHEIWANLTGDDSFLWDNFLQYHEKAVHFFGDQSKRFPNSTQKYDASVMGDGTGVVSVSYANYAQGWASWAQRGLQAIGLPIIDGMASGNLLGQAFGTFTINQTTGTRDSSESSYLRRALAYDNYIVYVSTLARQILFNKNKRAVGVLVDTQGLEYVISARKEVIVTAGVFGSPQLLMVSGIGPKDALDSLNIPVVADLPGVGQNMKDHIYFGPSYRVNAPTDSSLADPVFYAAQAEAFNQNASGIFSNPTTDIISFEKLPEKYRGPLSNATKAKLATYPADWPELEYLALGAYLGTQENLALGDPHDGYNYASIAVALCTPISVGSLTIVSNNTNDHPKINPNFLLDDADIEVAVAGFKRVRQIWDSKAMAGIRIGAEAYPGPSVKTDKQIADVIRRTYNTIYHAACTCKMGKRSDPQAVVDNKARVYGVKGLRVVDASSFPILPPGHPMATVYAYAEKMACAITGAC